MMYPYWPYVSTVPQSNNNILSVVAADSLWTPHVDGEITSSDAIKFSAESPRISRLAHGDVITPLRQPEAVPSLVSASSIDRESAAKSFEQSIADWVQNTAVEATIADIGQLLFHRSHAISIRPIDIHQNTAWRERAKAILNETVSVGEFSDDDLDMQLLLNDQSGVAAMGLLPYIALRRDAHRFKGLGEAELAASAVGFKHSDLLMDLKRHGQRAFVKPSFRPNGGRNFRQSKSYNENSALCNKHMFKLLTAGKAVIVCWDSLSPAEQSVIHVNTLQLAASSNPNREGRCCINMSYRTPLSGHRGNGQSSKLMSINEGTDLVESDKHYPPVDLPTAQDLCELAETQRAVFQPLGEDLAGATIDI
jgi:hypothetical protein